MPAGAPWELLGALVGKALLYQFGTMSVSAKTPITVAGWLLLIMMSPLPRANVVVGLIAFLPRPFHDEDNFVDARHGTLLREDPGAWRLV